MPQPADQKYQRQRLAAVRAAAEVFAADGYHGASTKAIAERMGIKQASLYYYFKSKQHALAEVCMYGLEGYVSRLETILESPQPFAAKLLAIFTAHLSAYREKNEAFKVYNDERLYLPEDARVELKQLGSGYRQSLEALLEQAAAQGDIRSGVDCHFAAQTVIGLGNAWGDLIVRDAEIDVVKLAQHCTDLFMYGAAAPVDNRTPGRTGQGN